jgi:hypothetical protein
MNNETRKVTQRREGLDKKSGDEFCNILFSKPQLSETVA